MSRSAVSCGSSHYLQEEILYLKTVLVLHCWCWESLGVHCTLKPWALCEVWTTSTDTWWVPVHTLTAVVMAAPLNPGARVRPERTQGTSLRPVSHTMLGSHLDLSQADGECSRAAQKKLCLNHAPWFRLGWHFWEWKGVLGRRVILWVLWFQQIYLSCHVLNPVGKG